MIRTLETACNNNISHPSLLHKPFLFLDQAFLYGCILSPQVFGVISIALELTPKAMEITPKACGDKTNRKKTFNPTAGKV